MSQLKLSSLANQAGTEETPIADVIHGSARAWVNFDGTGTVAINASYNVSSITDNGVGKYTLNFTTAMEDANFATSLTCGDIATGSRTAQVYGRSVSSVLAFYTNGASAGIDLTHHSAAIFR